MSKRYQGGVLGVGFNPLQAPNAPTSVTATKGDTTASVAFTAPANVGGSAITSYAVQSSPGAIAATGSASPITVSGLTNGTAYTFQVTALNSYGPSPAGGPSNSVTPAAPVGWIGILGGGSAEGTGGLTLDSSNNLYVGGFTNQGGNYGTCAIKITSAGVITWQRKLTHSNNTFGQSIAIDTSGNVYTAGYSNLGYQNSTILAKYNSSGTIQWQRYLSPGNSNVYGWKVTTDSSANVYITGEGSWTGNSAYNCGYIAKYNSSGTLQSVKALKVYTSFSMRSDTTSFTQVDSSGNIYACGTRTYFNSVTIQRIYVIKFDSSFNTLWMKEIVGNNSDYGQALVLNSSGDIYVACQNKFGTDHCLLLKYNNSGTLQWQRRLGDGTNNGGWGSVALDSAGNVYAFGYFYISGTYKNLIAKYNSSGVLQWQRWIGNSGNQYGGTIAIGSDDNIYISASITTSTSEMLIAKLANDGTGTGTYTVGGTTVTYAASTLTDSNAGYSEDTPFLAGGDLSYSPGTPTLTDSATTLTLSTTPA